MIAAAPQMRCGAVGWMRGRRSLIIRIWLVVAADDLDEAAENPVTQNWSGEATASVMVTSGGAGTAPICPMNACRSGFAMNC